MIHHCTRHSQCMKYTTVIASLTARIPFPCHSRLRLVPVIWHFWNLQSKIWSNLSVLTPQRPQGSQCCRAILRVPQLLEKAQFEQHSYRDLLTLNCDFAFDVIRTMGLTNRMCRVQTQGRKCQTMIFVICTRWLWGVAFFWLLYQVGVERFWFCNPTCRIWIPHVEGVL